jgi:anti-anti-sigma factor
MRMGGVADVPVAVPGGHLCWVFGDDSFPAVAAAFLGDGLIRGERLLFVADAADDVALLDLLGDLPDAPGLAAADTLSVIPARDLYVPGGVIEPERQVSAYAHLTDAALAAGYTGLRVAADATLLVQEPTWRADFIRYESAIDAFMARAPMTALCAYDQRVLGDAVAELACVHPQRHMGRATDPGFCLYHRHDSLRVEGELDVAVHPLLEPALDAAIAVTERDVILDLGGLDFVDVGGLTRIRQLADDLREQGRRLTIRDAAAMLRRSWSIIGYDGVENVSWEAAA